MRDWLPTLIFAAGFLQLSVLVASALVPVRLQWAETLKVLPKLQRQLHWTYAAYIVLAIVGFGVLCLLNAEELAGGSLLARSVCAYVAIFWGVRLSLQGWFDVQEYLTTWWLRLGYHTLTALFVCFVVVFGWAALQPG